ncbi:MAG: hypothetical protein HY094_07460 [Candidatus Melainabacteria bacterium]|nr:hypothetical protein [Candidatus Melainabacteria bacterium]
MHLVLNRRLIFNVGYLQDYFPEKKTAKLLQEQFEARKTAEELTRICSKSEKKLKRATSQDELNRLEKSHQTIYWAKKEAAEKSYLINDTLSFRATLN